MTLSDLVSIHAPTVLKQVMQIVVFLTRKFLSLKMKFKNVNVSI